MKHRPFESQYRTDFELLEQHQGDTRLYPHTGQLPTILRAIQQEFSTGLPARIARVDHRASGFDKVVRKAAAMFYCNWINAARKDDLRLHALLDRHMVSRPCIVQQITEDHRRGRTHRFRFYGGEDFFTEIFLCGKRVVFSDHVLHRFSARTENYIGEDLSNLLLIFFGSPIIAMSVGVGRAFIVSNLGSILAFPYRVSADEFFISSCLTINEIHSMEMEVPPHAVNAHYELPFQRPRIRNWMPGDWMRDYYQAWDRKTLPTPSKARKNEHAPKENWFEIAHYARDWKKKEGHGPGSSLYFLDNIPGPFSFDCTPGKRPLEYDELDTWKKVAPDYDWEAIIAERQRNGTYPQ